VNRQHEGHRGDDVATGRLETAGAVAERARLGAQIDESARVTIVGADGGDGVLHLLAIGADVLHRGRADEARDAGKALDPRKSVVHSAGHEGVPRLPCRERHAGEASFPFDVHTARRHPDDESAEPLVRHDEVAAAPEHEGRDSGCLRFRERFRHIQLLLHRHDTRGLPSETQGRQGGQRDVAIEAHRGRV
jgi:hypothetical protein